MVILVRLEVETLDLELVLILDGVEMVGMALGTSSLSSSLKETPVWIGPTSEL